MRSKKVPIGYFNSDVLCFRYHGFSMSIAFRFTGTFPLVPIHQPVGIYNLNLPRSLHDNSYLFFSARRSFGFLQHMFRAVVQTLTHLSQSRRGSTHSPILPAGSVSQLRNACIHLAYHTPSAPEYCYHLAYGAPTSLMYRPALLICRLDRQSLTYYRAARLTECTLVVLGTQRKTESDVIATVCELPLSRPV